PGALFRAAKAAGPDVDAAEGNTSRTGIDLADVDDGEVGDDGDVVAVQPSRMQRVSFTLTRDLEKRLDKYLVDRITFLSRNKLQELIDAGRVTVNERVAKSSTKLRLGDVVEVLIDAPPSEDYPPQDIPLDVLYEDEHMIVLNKSPDIIVHPARTHTEGTMINALAYHFRHRSKTGGGLSGVGGEFARPGVVHRLDRQTSGVIVFAKSDTAHWKLAEQFEKRSTDKRYVAFVHGKVEPLVDVIDVPIGPHPSREKGFREKQVVRHDHLGKSAVSVYRVLGRYRLAGGTQKVEPLAKKKRGGWTVTATDKAGAAASPSEQTMGRDSPWISVVEVELKTGRTHQIRVHFQHRQHPLLADDMYEGRAIAATVGAKKAAVTIGRVALHAAMLKIKHPITGKVMEFVAPLPADLKSLLKGLRKTGEGADEPVAPPGSVLGLEALLK
ncbi:MAG: RluA family pseudouridine synthase, partial [Phycisphaerales bacterium]|nr:RluA family pseudouridine synthase [Phycisphaerales bacterium]